MDDLTPLRQQWLDRIKDAADPATIEEVRLAALGKKGEISLKMRELGKMSPEERQTTGKALNALRDEIDTALRARKASLDDAALEARLAGEWLDVTLPGQPGHGRGERDLRRYGLCRRRRTAGRNRLV